MNTSLEFAFNGVHSSTFDVYRVTLESGMLTEEYFLANKSVNTFKLKNDIRSHKTSVNKEPLVIPLVLWLNGNVDEEKEQRIKEWLETDDFCRLEFDGSKYHYNAMLQGQAKFTHDSVGDGYVELEFLTDSPYRFSDEISPNNLDEPLGYSDGKTIRLINDGNKTIYPIIEITAPGTIDGLEIYNKTTEQRFVLNGEYTDLTMTIYNEYEELHTEGNFTDLYDNHNGVFIGLRPGRNDIQIKGRFYYKITYQNVYL